MEKPEKKEEIAKYISTENKKVNDSSVLKREDGMLAFLEIMPFIQVNLSRLMQIQCFSWRRTMEISDNLEAQCAWIQAICNE